MKGPFNRVKYDPRRTWECPTCHHRERSECEATFRICRRKLSGQTCNAWMKLIEEARPIRTRSIFAVHTFATEPNSASTFAPAANVEATDSERKAGERNASEKSASEQTLAASTKVEAAMAQDEAAVPSPSELQSAASETAPSSAAKAAPAEKASGRAPGKPGGRRSRRRRRGRSK